MLKFSLSMKSFCQQIELTEGTIGSPLIALNSVLTGVFIKLVDIEFNKGLHL